MMATRRMLTQNNRHVGLKGSSTRSCPKLLSRLRLSPVPDALVSSVSKSSAEANHVRVISDAAEAR